MQEQGPRLQPRKVPSIISKILFSRSYPRNSLSIFIPYYFLCSNNFQSNRNLHYIKATAVVVTYSGVLSNGSIFDDN